MFHRSIQFVFVAASLLTGWTTSAQFSHSRYGELLALHVEGRLEINELSVSPHLEKEVAFVCFSKQAPNQSISLTMSYRTNASTSLPSAVAYSFISDSAALTKVLRSVAFVLEPAHIADFDGLLLVGGRAEARKVESISNQDVLNNSGWQIALSQHVQSRLRVLSIFLLQPDNHEADAKKTCEQKNHFEYLCIEADAKI